MGPNGYVDELIEASLQDLQKREPGNDSELYIMLEGHNGVSRLNFYCGKPLYWDMVEMLNGKEKPDKVIVSRRVG